jgi:hypothetical protein
MPSLTRFEQLLCRFASCGVKFVLIRGVASSIHGSSRATFDLDLLYERSDQNLVRVIDALAPLHPYLRGAPPGLPFRFDFKTLQNGLNFTLTSDLGDVEICLARCLEEASFRICFRNRSKCA